jgi:hypothetical protein
MKYARHNDPVTSHWAVDLDRIRSQKLRGLVLLAEQDREEGWNWVEAEEALPPLALGDCPWHRFTSDLRKHGWAAWVLNEDGDIICRPGKRSAIQGCIRITKKGRRKYEELKNLQADA